MRRSGNPISSAAMARGVRAGEALRRPPCLHGYGRSSFSSSTRHLKATTGSTSPSLAIKPRTASLALCSRAWVFLHIERACGRPRRKRRSCGVGDHPTRSRTESFLTPPWYLPGNYAHNPEQADVESRRGRSDTLKAR
jgi:hypothetical protein